ncbi:MAG: carbonic anhydrase [Janthinobacterium lividum]
MSERPILNRRRMIGALGLTGAGITLGVGASPASAAEPWPSTGDAALNRLIAGNIRFATGQAHHSGQDVDAVHASAQGQHPFVIALGCSDSRVSPELLFDEGVGAVFDQRVAGGIVDSAILGSIEFAVGEFAPPLLLVLGHERCGAVSATVKVVESGGRGPEHVQRIVEAIRPAVLAVRDQPGDLIENAVRENTRMVTEQLVKRSRIIRRAVRAGSLDVRGARYDLDTGLVEVL